MEGGSNAIVMRCYDGLGSSFTLPEELDGGLRCVARRAMPVLLMWQTNSLPVRLQSVCLEDGIFILIELSSAVLAKIAAVTREG
jgi:hypothetical protein